MTSFLLSALSVDEQIDTVESKYEASWEPQLFDMFEKTVECSADIKSSDKSCKLGEFIIQKMNPYSFDKLSVHIYAGMKSMKWQVKVFSLVMLSNFATYHPLVTTQNMPEIIMNLIGISSDVKKEVKTQTLKTFQTVCSTIENVDIKHLIPVVISAYMNPSLDTQKALDALVSTPFVNDIDIPTMGFLAPLLTKSMREKKMVYQRRAAVVIET